MSEDLQREIIQVLSDVLDVDRSSIGPSGSSESIQAWDSVGHLNLMIALEERFDMQFAPEDVENMHSVETLVRVVSRYRAERR